ncbi:hypothetical protein BB558_000697 [Smittium angustum]|uniref:Exportin-7/Ran-binding protein 17 TPR repeats domain-containing protein n=1 Tax=Smittium angustum TaxID=133377 RepID=A0A2U1JDR2_SMIAN|nr:hypothetical protein BB558_000697 [Smittium angustum]
MDLESQEQPSIKLFDSLCLQLYESIKSDVRSLAEKRLGYYFPTFLAEQNFSININGNIDNPKQIAISVYEPIKTPVDSVRHLVWFLEQTQSEYSRFYAAQRIKILIYSHISSFTKQNKKSLGTNILENLKSFDDKTPKNMISEMAQTLAIIIMSEWLQSDDIIEFIDQLLSLTKDTHYNKLKALQTLRIIVEEMSREQPQKRIQKQQRIVTGFKDKKLKLIMQAAVDIMKDILDDEKSRGISEKEKLLLLLESTLLQKEIYSFDFVGLSNDESSDNNIALQIPATWRDIICDQNLLETYFEGYKKTSYPINTQFMELLVYFSSFRRTIYTEEGRKTFIWNMAQGIIDILNNSIGLDEVDNYHHMCRLLARLRTIHTMLEIEDKPIYEEFLDSVTRFSLTGLSLWEWSSSSVSPLLTFWVKACSSKDYISTQKGSTNNLDEKIRSMFQQIVTSYLISLVSMATKSISESDQIDIPLENEDEITDQLAMIATIARVVYSQCVQTLMQAINSIASQYQNIISTGTSQTNAIFIYEAQLSWLLNAAGAFIAARKPYQSPAEDEDLDAEMIAAVIKLDNLYKLRVTNVNALLYNQFDMAFIKFYSNYKSKYLTEQSHRLTRLFGKLSIYLGEVNLQQSLEIIVQRILQNVSVQAADSLVLLKSLDLLYDLSLGYQTVRQISSLESIKNLLENHRNDSLSFLRTSMNYKVRARYYASLCRILCISDNLDGSFHKFVKVWENQIKELKNNISNLAHFNQQNTKNQFICLLQDLRGFVSSLVSKNSYTMFFNWLFFGRLKVLHSVMAIYSMNHDVQIAFLKLIKEFVLNKSQRLSFDISSPNGILVFRQASEILCEFGMAIKSNTNPISDIYKQRYKPIAICFDILTNILVGRYVAIGVMPIYNDKALDNAYTSYTKACSSLLNILDALFSSTNISLVKLDWQTLSFILELLANALQSQTPSISSTASSILDSIYTYTIESANSETLEFYEIDSAIEIEDGSGRSKVCSLLSGRQDIQKKFLILLYDMLLFEDRQNDWSLSRSLYPLAVLQKEASDNTCLYEHSSYVVQYQPPEKQDQLIKSIGSILSSSNYTLSTSNRDKFTQSITQYRRDVATHNIVLITPTNQSGNSAAFDFTDVFNKMAE